VLASVLYPRWLPEFAFGYGHPVLNFFGPLSYYWGLPFTLLGVDAALALKLEFATGLIASALGMVLLARLHLDRGAALVAAVVYAYLPYHLVDLYVLGAVAEFLAFVWFPLVLWAFHRMVTGPANQRPVRGALAALLFAAMVVTHSLSALVFAPVLGIYLIILLARAPDRGAVVSVALALLLSAALAAFYWLPVLVESGYVGLGQGASRGYQDHLVRLSDLFSERRLSLPGRGGRCAHLSPGPGPACHPCRCPDHGRWVPPARVGQPVLPGGRILFRFYADAGLVARLAALGAGPGLSPISLALPGPDRPGNCLPCRSAL
jgi:hypothetical protein